MKFEPTINLYLEYCMSRQLRSRTIEAYEQTLRLFVNWLREAQAIEDVENVKDGTVRKYILDLQKRGKYYAVHVKTR